MRCEGSSKVMAIDSEIIDSILRDFVTDTRHVQGAVLVTLEGLPIAGRLPDTLDMARAAAMAAAVMTIGDRVGEDIQRGPVQQMLVQGSAGYSILSVCGDEALFVALTSLDIQQGLLLIEIKRIVEEISQIMSISKKY